jgi:D-alanyl-D-alanine carboxypeptidase
VHPVFVAPPSALVPADRAHRKDPRKRVLVDPAAYAAYARMKTAAEQDGILSPFLCIVSAYRTVEEQQVLWDNGLIEHHTPEETVRWVARPGYSVHHTGRALDLWLGGGTSHSGVGTMRRTPAYRWMVCNAARFGFFPYAREPWHWEFNPPSPLPRPPGLLIQRPVPLPPPAGVEPPAGLGPLLGPGVAPTAANALAIVRALAASYNIPWIVPYVVLEHEGGLRLFRHPDGVMQTTSIARPGIASRISRPLKLFLLGRPATDAAPTPVLNRQLLDAFPGQLAVQIAFGTEALAYNLHVMSDYLALALIGYNAGPGHAIRVANNGVSSQKPRGISPADWEQRCRFGASLYHLLPASVTVDPVGQWHCDWNTDWYRSTPVHAPGGLQLYAYEYLRRVRICTTRHPPNLPCHGDPRATGHSAPGTGEIHCVSRAGALDKIYDPQQLDAPYRAAAGALLQPIPQDEMPLKRVGRALIKMPALRTPPT